MLNKKMNLLKILAVGVMCALASIFLFTGCADKSSKNISAPETSEYGLYTNLTLSIDCGEGKVWATVKNTFTFMPSTVRVTVELYTSESYKESYKEMELASENTVADLDMGETLTAEAETGGRQAYWQARAYYKIDEKDWQEQTTNIWLIKGNGNIVTTNATSATGDEVQAKISYQCGLNVYMSDKNQGYCKLILHTENKDETDEILDIFNYLCLFDYAQVDYDTLSETDKLMIESESNMPNGFYISIGLSEGTYKNYLQVRNIFSERFWITEDGRILRYNVNTDTYYVGQTEYTKIVENLKNKGVNL